MPWVTREFFTNYANIRLSSESRWSCVETSCAGWEQTVVGGDKLWWVGTNCAGWGQTVLGGDKLC